MVHQQAKSASPLTCVVLLPYSTSPPCLYLIVISCGCSTTSGKSLDQSTCSAKPVLLDPCLSGLCSNGHVRLEERCSMSL